MLNKGCIYMGLTARFTPELQKCLLTDLVQVAAPGRNHYERKTQHTFIYFFITFISFSVVTRNSQITQTPVKLKDKISYTVNPE